MTERLFIEHYRMKFRPDAVGGHCGTWDTSTYQPPKTHRRLQYNSVSDGESQNDDSNSSLEWSNNFHAIPSESKNYRYREVNHLHHVNISPVDDSNHHVSDSKRHLRKMRHRRRIELQRSRERDFDSSSEYEESMRLRFKNRSLEIVEGGSVGCQNTEASASCSDWDISEVSTQPLNKQKYHRKRGEDWEVFTIYPEPTPVKMDKHELRRRRKSADWDEHISQHAEKYHKKKKAYSYELKKSRFWEELSTISQVEKPKNDYHARKHRDKYEPTIPFVEKYDPSYKKSKLTLAMTSTCTKKKHSKEYRNINTVVDWAELSSIYPERDLKNDWSTIKPFDSTPHNLSALSSIHPSEVTTHLSDQTSLYSSVIPDNPNNTLVSSVLLQHGGDPNIRNTDGKTPLDLADPTAKAVLTGEYKKDELLEAARSGNEEKLMSLLTTLNVNCHASDGRKVSISRETDKEYSDSKIQKLKICKLTLSGMTNFRFFQTQLFPNSKFFRQDQILNNCV